jgi:hypothetical protein
MYCKHMPHLCMVLLLLLLLLQAAADVEIKAHHPIQLRDVQQLVLWVLGDAVAPRWVFTKVRQQQQQRQIMCCSSSAGSSSRASAVLGAGAVPAG